MSNPFITTFPLLELGVKGSIGFEVPWELGPEADAFDHILTYILRDPGATAYVHDTFIASLNPDEQSSLTAPEVAAPLTLLEKLHALYAAGCGVELRRCLEFRIRSHLLLGLGDQPTVPPALWSDTDGLFHAAAGRIKPDMSQVLAWTDERRQGYGKCGAFVGWHGAGGLNDPSLGHVALVDPIHDLVVLTFPSQPTSIRRVVVTTVQHTRLALDKGVSFQPMPDLKALLAVAEHLDLLVGPTSSSVFTVPLPREFVAAIWGKELWGTKSARFEAAAHVPLPLLELLPLTLYMASTIWRALLATSDMYELLITPSPPTRGTHRGRVHPASPRRCHHRVAQGFRHLRPVLRLLPTQLLPTDHVVRPHLQDMLFVHEGQPSLGSARTEMTERRRAVVRELARVP